MNSGLRAQRGYTLVELLLAMAMTAMLLVSATLTTSGIVTITQHNQQQLQTHELIYITQHFRRAIAAAGLSSEPFVQTNQGIEFNGIRTDNTLLLRTSALTRDQRDCLHQKTNGATLVITSYQFNPTQFDGTILCRSSLAVRSDHIANHVADWHVHYTRLTTAASVQSLRLIALTQPPNINQQLIDIVNRFDLTASMSVYASQPTARSLATYVSIPTYLTP